MDAFRVSVESHPVLVALHHLLAELLIAPRREPEVVGDLDADLRAGIPSVDRMHPTSIRCRHMVDIAQRARALVGTWETRAATYYPAGGGMGWHTDSGRPGWRAYVVLPLGRSRFLTADAAFQDVGGTAMVFRAGPGGWHAVQATDERFSIGVRIPDADAEMLRASLV